MFSNAWIGLGGNLGNVHEAMVKALYLLDNRLDSYILAVSSIYKTAPWGQVEQPCFLNACAKIATTLEPEALLQCCLDIEKEMKRDRIQKWGPRTIDLDLLLYGNREISIPGRLILPHMHITQRAFVLIPLAEISPDILVKGRRVADLANQCYNEKVRKLIFKNPWWKTPCL
ncbi:MAG: 2-amino-4-hydroxy-6-hydroxymethyldihydropteridine diphosphokinase [Candidatus Tokpelaia sp. JSC161]|nr:MAG: 2-amino-4-hydroxy-6-hydroxymethyldihydropteridine diphosphokinase [Candidatus Tokpelaia sp. JSC161]